MLDLFKDLKKIYDYFFDSIISIIPYYKLKSFIINCILKIKRYLKYYKKSKKYKPFYFIDISSFLYILKIKNLNIFIFLFNISRIVFTQLFFIKYRILQLFSPYIFKKKKNLNYIYNIKKYNYIWSISYVLFFSFIFAIFIYYYLLYIRLLPAAKLLLAHFILLNFVYLLISGFIFFYKKYRYNRYTSVIQRFWKRSYILFWLLESAIFTIFLYLTLNASEEPFYMYDQIKYNKTHLYSWRSFILLSTLYLLLILSLYSIQYLNKWALFSNLKPYLLFTTFVFIIIICGEFFQFFHIVNFYTNLFWNYDYDENYWILEMEYRRTRLVNNYVTVCLAAKFWHLVFIAGFWFFFLLRSFETNRFGHLALSANIQNFIILYLMLWLYMYPWFKYIFRKFLHIPYYWFANDQRQIMLNIILFDFIEYIKSLYSILISFFGKFNSILYTHYLFNSTSFFYWIDPSNQTTFEFYKKSILRTYFIKFIINN